jgi:hypothetical protein
VPRFELEQVRGTIEGPEEESLEEEGEEKVEEKEQGKDTSFGVYFSFFSFLEGNSKVGKESRIRG